MPVWNVSTTGSDTTGNGSSGSPYATLSKAVSESSNGDTIKIKPGNYVESKRSSNVALNINKQLTLIGRSTTLETRPEITLESITDQTGIQIIESNVSLIGLTFIHKTFSGSSEIANGGGGGAATTQGSNSVFSTITSTGGGAGAYGRGYTGGAGGSGGGSGGSGG